ncbi:MAG: GNAT family N-acetyltransferase [Actinomycetota bacterium]|nr:GNAT family N-acetyltransferase [Actinomycetota bacterium]
MRATAEHARVAAELLDAFNREFDDPTPGPDVLEERLRALIGRDDVEVLLPDEGPDGIALLTYRPGIWDEGPVALLEELYVRPELRNRGIGTRLLHEAFAVSRAKGCRSFEIEVDEEDVEAQRFYERHGVSPYEPGREFRAFYYRREL